ncbi:hypothetical protein [Uliginosibacterium sp. H1]|uniref:hypothetical protein n=1 Tax=Uliginosibacterium sp. H1 TaxID=3114757 RepID=UPI002E18D76D|nr:hypothetical protein [Uliginosibacterium sp. H1]
MPTPRQVLLFAGHMIDAPQRSEPRFPAALADAAADRIAQVLAWLDAGPEDLALTQGAAGGDLLFAEACLARGVPLCFMQPLPEPAFIAASVLPVQDGPRWQARYQSVRAGLLEAPRQLPTPSVDEQDVTGDDVPSGGAGDGDDDSEVFSRCNRWLLRHALRQGAERLHFICLWDGLSGDGDGGTAHLCALVEQAPPGTWQVHRIRPQDLAASHAR